MPQKILIVDDHPSVRIGFAMRISIEPDLEVCGEASTPPQALELVGQLEPELALIDISLKNGNGLELVRTLAARHPLVRLLVVSGFDESLYAERALRAGALGYLNKQESNDELMKAIRTVLAGERYVSDALAQRLVNQALGKPATKTSALESLTDRELEVFRMIGQGLMTGEIAARLFLSPHTIDTHRENIKRKLGLHKAAELARAAVQWTLEHG